MYFVLKGSKHCITKVREYIFAQSHLGFDKGKKTPETYSLEADDHFN